LITPMTAGRVPQTRSHTNTGRSVPVSARRDSLVAVASSGSCGDGRQSRRRRGSGRENGSTGQRV
jgi:hypothetical protein